MIDAFLSYAHEDRKYLGLTIRLLEFHRITVWHDTTGIVPGSRYRDELDKAITAAGRLLVMVTAAALRSRWVAREIAQFHGRRPDAAVLPLLFEDVPADELFTGLADLAPIRFHDDLDAGYAALMAAFDRPYLPLVERRSIAERRVGERRGADRRVMSTEARLRIGMWKNYAAATGHGEYDEFGGPDPRAGALPHQRGDDTVVGGRLTAINRLAAVFAADGSELSRYRFLDRADGSEVRFGFEDLRTLAHTACREVERNGQLRNVYVVEHIAERLSHHYDVHQRDRRVGDRRTGTDRRDR
jgi:TIR domain-containing protein